ncbi:MAG: helix-turn-helix domain containing protein [Zoogloeaceae bacterium]|jgi:hypothetical protein|nr:helix-turn-helix domain containing protein [Zoogloeaceae bacterium]
MNFFSDSAARLKYALRVSKDGEVAAALGLSKTAFAERKRRGAFPEKELHALAARRPDLALDVGYVLNGVAGSAAGENKSLVEIIDRFLTVYRLNAEQADEALSLPPGTIARALSFQLPAEPGGCAGRANAVRPYTPDEAALLENYRNCPEDAKKIVRAAVFAGARLEEESPRRRAAHGEAGWFRVGSAFFTLFLCLGWLLLAGIYTGGMTLLGAVTGRLECFGLALLSFLALCYSWRWGYARFVRDDCQTICAWRRCRQVAANDPVYTA